MKYKVETLTGNDWDDCWTVDEGNGPVPMRFDTVAEALEELEDHFRCMDEAGMDYEREEFRIVEAKDE